MGILPRRLRLDLAAGRSAFLWGPRKTGKTTYLKTTFPDSLVFDLLDTDLAFEFLKRPALLRERLLAADPDRLKVPVILDEVQKVPALLDEIHGLIESPRHPRFILCGSSARKLRRSGVNLLGGRAWRFEMHPLAFPELEAPDLLRILNRGLIPSHYLDEEYSKSLRAYVRDYLKEEVFNEGLVRNLPAFSRFLDAVGYSHGELVNHANIARDCGVDAKTVREYYQILVDTLLGVHLEPYKKRQERQVITKAGKFYLFDVGVAGSLVHRTVVEERGEDFGKAFEHYVLMELLAHRSYEGLDHEIRFWRTKSGLEVDFILGAAEAAIEVKGTSRVDPADLRGLRRFREDHHPKKAIVVSNERAPRLHEGIEIVPWRDFLGRLWSGSVLS